MLVQTHVRAVDVAPAGAQIGEHARGRKLEPRPRQTQERERDARDGEGGRVEREHDARPGRGDEQPGERRPGDRRGASRQAEQRIRLLEAAGADDLRDEPGRGRREERVRGAVEREEDEQLPDPGLAGEAAGRPRAPA